MSAARSEGLGLTRVCPHCKATVLANSAVCPGCQHHLRFSQPGESKPGIAGYPALRFEGTFAHQQADTPCEYSVVLAVLNERGEKLTRQVINVGALRPSEKRTLSLSVEILPARELPQPQAQPRPPTQPQKNEGPGIAPRPFKLKQS